MEYKFPVYLQFGEYMFTVNGFINECDEYVDNKGYINREDGIVYIYSVEPDIKTKKHIAYFWKNTKGFGFSNITPNTKKYMIVDKIIEWDFDKIVEESDEDKELYDEELINNMNASTDIFVPIINDSDDFLKKIIKTAIIEKNVDIKRFQHRLSTKYELTNMKSALIGTTKMSVPNFMIWAELLGVDWEVVISDNGTDKITPLKSELVYRSELDNITKMGELK